MPPVLVRRVPGTFPSRSVVHRSHVRPHRVGPQRSRLTSAGGTNGSTHRALVRDPGIGVRHLGRGTDVSGRLRGVVRDPQGVIPGAEVTLINEDTNAARSAMTNEVGEYAFPSVLPATYTVRVSLPGFKTEERKGFRIGTQQSIVAGLHARGRRHLRSRSPSPAKRRSSSARARRMAASLDKETLAEPADLRPQHLLSRRSRRRA